MTALRHLESFFEHPHDVFDTSSSKLSLIHEAFVAETNATVAKKPRTARIVGPAADRVDRIRCSSQKNTRTKNFVLPKEGLPRLSVIRNAMEDNNSKGTAK